MGFLFTGLFWGIVIILIGLSVVLKAVLHIDIPIFKLVVGFVLIYWGLVVLTGFSGWQGWQNKNSLVFTEGKIADQQSEYNIIFSSGEIDLTNIKPEGRTPIKISTVFGSGKVIINKTVPTKIKLSSAFASGQAPDNNITAFGDYRYKNAEYKEDTKDFLDIEASVVFGDLKIEEK